MENEEIERGNCLVGLIFTILSSLAVLILFVGLGWFIGIIMNYFK